MSPPNLLTEWAALFVDSLLDAGVSDVVVSPGSRSTPLAWAFVRSSRARCHSVIDERVAGFFAVGQAKVTGRPTVVVCTSGSAAAHYFPAVVEAGMSHVPLVVVSADRPFELQGCDASQTIDQIKLYGGQARAFFEVGMPNEEEGALRALRRLAAQCVQVSSSPDPGPVHVNFRAPKPLEPVGPGGAEGERLRERARAVAREPLTAVAGPRSEPDGEAIERVAAACLGARRGLIVCGPLPISPPVDLDALARLDRKSVV